VLITIVISTHDLQFQQFQLAGRTPQICIDKQ